LRLQSLLPGTEVDQVTLTELPFKVTSSV